MIKKSLFCANCQADTDHSLSIVGRELIAECSCGRFIKWPAGFTEEQWAEAFRIHKEHNLGQKKVTSVSQAESDLILEKVEKI